MYICTKKTNKGATIGFQQRNPGLIHRCFWWGDFYNYQGVPLRWVPEIPRFHHVWGPQGLWGTARHSAFRRQPVAIRRKWMVYQPVERFHQPFFKESFKLMRFKWWKIWLVVTGTMEFGLTFHSVGNVIIPTEEVIFFRGVGSATNQSNQQCLFAMMRWWCFLLTFLCHGQTPKDLSFGQAHWDDHWWTNGMRIEMTSCYELVSEKGYLQFQWIKKYWLLCLFIIY